jgi:mRNA-degrading endonuclease YafQ of YafQ-DinJ toxin-antitoxin module
MFTRKAKRLVRKRPELAQELRATLILLSEDAFTPVLKTHKLKGNLSNSWACSVTFDLRIIFKLVDDDGQEFILLETIGSHDVVY